MQRADVLIVGGGAVGTAAARSLSARGRAVTLFERARIGHSGGSSGGPTRIFRVVYDDPDYVRMARRSLPEWRKLEAEAGEDLLITTASVDVGSEAMAAVDALVAAGESFTLPSAAETMERWPALRIAEGETVVVQEDGAVCMAARTLAAQARVARSNGAELLEDTEILAIRPVADGVEVVTSDSTWRAPVAVVAAGAWARGLLAEPVEDLPLVPSLEQVTYLDLETPSPLPTLIEWAPVSGFQPYAVPDPTVPGAFKIALHTSGPPVDPDGYREVDAHREAVATGYAGERFAAHRIGASETCFYTRTPDLDFALDRRGPVVVASPCSGHGFKFVPLLGELVADLATGTEPSFPIGRFGVGRFS